MSRRSSSASGVRTRRRLRADIGIWLFAQPYHLLGLAGEPVHPLVGELDQFAALGRGKPVRYQDPQPLQAFAVVERPQCRSDNVRVAAVPTAGHLGTDQRLRLAIELHVHGPFLLNGGYTNSA